MTCTALLTRGPGEGLPATGSTAGYRRHRRAGERACPLCARANREATRRARAVKATRPRGPVPPPVQAAAAASTIAELFRMNRLGPVDVARVETVLGLAELCDIAPWNPSLWGVYRRALAELQAETTD